MEREPTNKTDQYYHRSLKHRMPTKQEKKAITWGDRQPLVQLPMDSKRYWYKRPPWVTTSNFYEESIDNQINGLSEPTLILRESKLVPS